MRVIYHNWSATKQRPHPQSVAEISRHSVLSGDRIRQCETSSGSRHIDITATLRHCRHCRIITSRVLPNWRGVFCWASALEDVYAATGNCSSSPAVVDVVKCCSVAAPAYHHIIDYQQSTWQAGATISNCLAFYNSHFKSFKKPQADEFVYLLRADKCLDSFKQNTGQSFPSPRQDLPICKS